ncbi:MAG TPA: peptidyl-alpha-hydroxyglycine alpha-amidating lyase family protein [Gemmataceae bacterium]|nr:peptidyl-alpha-hydroxyglycine alpha-amidating lyase family protein [Gemmataceae bacterium]
MIKKYALFSGCIVLLCGVSFAARSPQVGEKVPEYIAVPNWLTLPKNFQFGPVTAVATDKDDNLYIFHRGKRPVAIFDKNGKFLRSWGNREVETAHGLRIDHDGNVWTTDLDTHQVIKHDPNGKVLLKLGKAYTAGTTPALFDQPADVAIAPNGDIYVADGYGNSRVVKFNKDGKYLTEWGKPGKGPGEFNLVHGIVLDAKGRVYVCDRENERIQVFDGDGKFLEQWRGLGTPYSMFLQGGQRMLVTNGHGNQVHLLDFSGKVLGRFGAKGKGPGQFLLAHGICADSRGVIYATEFDGQRVQKFVAK